MLSNRREIGLSQVGISFFFLVLTARKWQEWVSVNSFRGLPPSPRPSCTRALCYCCCVFPPPFCGPLSKPSRRPRRDVGKCAWAGDAPSASDMIAIKANNRLSQRPWQLSPWPLFFFVRFDTSSWVFFLFVLVNPFIPSILCNCNHCFA